MKFDSYVEWEENDFYIPIEKESILEDSIKNSLTNYLKDDTYFEACYIISGDKEVYKYGNTDIPYYTGSVRKSIYGLMYMKAIADSLIDINKTLAELGIDDKKNRLSDLEKTATVRNLLDSRSGIFIKGAGDLKGMRDGMPKRGSAIPGTQFYYSNWGFNILPILLEERTGMKTGELINDWFGKPLGMRYFNSSHVIYEYEDVSEYPFTKIHICAEDLAKFGTILFDSVLYSAHSLLNSKTVDENFTAPRRSSSFFDGYGMLWNFENDTETVWAVGIGTNILIVDRKRNISIAMLNNIGMSKIGQMYYYSTELVPDINQCMYVYKKIIGSIEK
jgi:CubicO group peptidase (beta-lactamase class C family)